MRAIQITGMEHLEHLPAQQFSPSPIKAPSNAPPPIPSHPLSYHVKHRNNKASAKKGGILLPTIIQPPRTVKPRAPHRRERCLVPLPARHIIVVIRLSPLRVESPTRAYIVEGFVSASPSSSIPASAVATATAASASSPVVLVPAAAVPPADVVVVIVVVVVASIVPAVCAVGAPVLVVVTVAVVLRAFLRGAVFPLHGPSLGMIVVELVGLGFDAELDFLAYGGGEDILLVWRNVLPVSDLVCVLWLSVSVRCKNYHGCVTVRVYDGDCGDGGDSCDPEVALVEGEAGHLPRLLVA